MMELDIARVETALGDDILYLDDDGTAAGTTGCSQFELFTQEGFLFKGNIAVCIGIGAADKDPVELRKGRVKEIFPAFE